MFIINRNKRKIKKQVKKYCSRNENYNRITIELWRFIDFNGQYNCTIHEFNIFLKVMIVRIGRSNIFAISKDYDTHDEETENIITCNFNSKYKAQLLYLNIYNYCKKNKYRVMCAIHSDKIEYCDTAT